MSDEKLGDRIVEFLRQRTQQYREQEKKQGNDPQNSSAAFEVNYIADELNVLHSAVKGALKQLHETRRVIGYAVVGDNAPPRLYAIALREP